MLKKGKQHKKERTGIEIRTVSCSHKTKSIPVGLLARGVGALLCFGIALSCRLMFFGVWNVIKATVMEGTRRKLTDGTPSPFLPGQLRYFPAHLALT